MKKVISLLLVGILMISLAGFVISESDNSGGDGSDGGHGGGPFDRLHHIGSPGSRPDSATESIPKQQLLGYRRALQGGAKVQVLDGFQVETQQ